MTRINSPCSLLTTSVRAGWHGYFGYQQASAKVDAVVRRLRRISAQPASLYFLIPHLDSSLGQRCLKLK